MIVRAWIDDSGTLRCASQVCGEDCPRWGECGWYDASFTDAEQPPVPQHLAYAVALPESDPLRAVLYLAYRALTEGMADVPAERRDPKCARLRAEAKREIRRVLGMRGMIMDRWEYYNAPKGREVDCPCCKGTGRILHACRESDLIRLETIYDWRGYGSSESLVIYRCRKCGQLWKIRWQWDDGTGHDDIWLKPGEEKRGYSFTQEEAAKFEEAVKQNA